MQNVPLHPVLVHVPLALAVLMPLLAAAALLAGWRGWLPDRRLWGAVVLLQAVLVGGAFAALQSGEGEEERVEHVVGEAALEAHEEAAQVFLAAAAAVLVLAAVATLIRHAGARRTLALLSLAGMLGVSALAYRTGRAGGELVYRRGAATAYMSSSAGGTAAGAAEGAAPARWSRSEDEDEDDD